MTPASLVRPPDDWKPPASSYVVCTTPRSGSTYLCRLLRGAGDMGQPDEYFGDGRYDAERRAGAAAWVGAVVAKAQTPNGVFGVKLFPPHHLALRTAGVRLPDWLPGLTHVYLRRRDLLGQAISFAIATQTDHWVSWRHPEQTREPQYDAGLIARLLDRLVEWESYWRRHFALSGVTPLELDYEAVAAAPRLVLADLRQRLGLPPSAAIGQPSERRQPARVQRTSRNDAWRARFLADLARDGYELLDRPRRARAGLGTLGDWIGGRLIQPSFRPRRKG